MKIKNCFYKSKYYYLKEKNMDKEILKKNIAAHGEYIELQVLEE